MNKRKKRLGSVIPTSFNQLFIYFNFDRSNNMLA